MATAVNAGLTMLYWRIGNRVGGEILKGKRAAYGKQIVATLSRQLAEEYGEGYAEKDQLQREFYAEMCRLEHWDTRTLRKRTDSMLYERTAISRKPEALAKKDLADWASFSASIVADFIAQVLP